jgi:hypothetical protein
MSRPGFSVKPRSARRLSKSPLSTTDTACERFMEACMRPVGMAQACAHRRTSASVSPLSSRPNTSAVTPAGHQVTRTVHYDCGGYSIRCHGTAACNSTAVNTKESGQETAPDHLDDDKQRRVQLLKLAVAEAKGLISPPSCHIVRWRSSHCLISQAPGDSGGSRSSPVLEAGSCCNCCCSAGSKAVMEAGNCCSMSVMLPWV